MKRYFYAFLFFILVFNALSIDTALASGNNTVRNSVGNPIGSVDSNGTIRNSNGTSIGKVDSDGTVRNSNGTPVGNARGVEKRIAAVIFFMNFFK